MHLVMVDQRSYENETNAAQCEEGVRHDDRLAESAFPLLLDEIAQEDEAQ